MGYHHKGDGEALAGVLERMGDEARHVRVSEVRRIVPYCRVSNLIGQASTAAPEHAPAILAEAHKSYLTLYAAFRSAAEMLNAANAAMAPQQQQQQTEPVSEPEKPARRGK